MIDSDAIHKRASQELFDATQEIYNPPKTESQKLNEEKIALRKRLVEIEQKENVIDPQIIEMKKRVLHHAVEMHKREKQLSNRQLDLAMGQDTGPGGVFVFKNKK